MTRAELENNEVGWCGLVGLEGLVGLVGRVLVVQVHDTDSMELGLTMAWSVEEGKYFLFEDPYFVFCRSRLA